MAGAPVLGSAVYQNAAHRLLIWNCRWLIRVPAMRWRLRGSGVGTPDRWATTLMAGCFHHNAPRSRGLNAPVVS